MIRIAAQYDSGNSSDAARKTIRISVKFST